MKYRNAILIVLLVIIADQALKIYIKTHFCNGDEVKIFGNWFRLHFIENDGMAYGMKLMDSETGKLLLSSFRLIAVIFGFYLLRIFTKKGYSRGFILCGSLILAGALGNLIDCLFYGLIFTDSPYSCFSGNYNNMHSLLQNHSQAAIAHFTTFGHGYGKILQGKVVDMLYFPIIETKNFIFFEPVFNIADAAISIGVITLLVFQKRIIHKAIPDEKPVTQ